MATPIPSLPPGAQARYETLVRHLSFAAKAWVTEEAARLTASGRPPVEAELVAAVRRRFRTDIGVHGALADGDVATMAFLVLMQAAKSAQEDLKSIMEKVRYFNQQKAQSSRPTQGLASSRVEWPPRAVTAAQASVRGVKNAQEASQDKLDALGELGSDMQQRLQVYMLSLSKTQMLISNLLKKVSETSSTIVQNLK